MVAPDSLTLAATEQLARKVLAERVRNLYEISPYGHVASLAGIAVAAYGLNGVIDGRFLVAWIILQLALVASLGVLYLRYRRSSVPGRDLEQWERRYALGAGASGMGWGLFAFVLMPSYSIPHQMLVTFIVLAMMLIGMGTMQASRRAFEWFALPAIAGLELELVSRGGSLYHVAAILVAALSALLLYLFIRVNREMAEMLTARFENDSLLQDFTRA